MHNKLSSPDLHANLAMLDKFREEKSRFFKREDWCLDKVRRPFVMWLTSLSEEKKQEMRKTLNS